MARRRSFRVAPRAASRALAVVAWVIVVAFAGRAEGDPPAIGAADEAPHPTVSVAPPPLDIPYVQYGFALTSEFVATAGKMCAGEANCILGSGGGVAVRVGRRAAGPWYWGGAYELSKQDPASLYRFATLQQLRAEARYYFSTGLVTQPYATGGGGVCAYGNEWGIDTYGPMAQLGIGVEAQLSRRTVVALALTYRVLGFRTFVDSSGNDHATSIAQIVGLDLSIEQRDPLARTVR
jgi:hypothetical protein